MANKKNKIVSHNRSLEKLMTFYKQAYSRHKQQHRQLLSILVTSKEPQEKVFDVMSIIRTMEVEDATETGKHLV